jgi:hypothetical protein
MLLKVLDGNEWRWEMHPRQAQAVRENILAQWLEAHEEASDAEIQAEALRLAGVKTFGVVEKNGRVVGFEVVE